MSDLRTLCLVKEAHPIILQPRQNKFENAIRTLARQPALHSSRSSNVDSTHGAQCLPGPPAFAAPVSDPSAQRDHITLAACKAVEIRTYILTRERQTRQIRAGCGYFFYAVSEGGR
jgi:hypothetical protein